MILSGSRSGLGTRFAVSAAAFLFLLLAGARDGRSQRSDQVTLTFLAAVTAQPAYSMQIQTFEQLHPNITITPTYAPTQAILDQLEATELAAGNAPDVLSTFPGCGTPISVCKLAKAGYLAPMLKKPWAKTSNPLVISSDKYGRSLFAYVATLSFNGLFTNDTMFRKLGLIVPQTFSQLLDVCRKAKAGGTIPVLLAAQGSNIVRQLVDAIALNTVYAKKREWGADLRAGTATFEGTPGWHQALQEFVEMNTAGCFQQGAAATTSPSGDAQFAQGQALMYFQATTHKGLIDAGGPQFTYSQHPFPTATSVGQTEGELGFANSLSVNARSSVQNQAAAQAFVDFIARPDQAALHARIDGGISEYQLVTGRLPTYLSSFAAPLSEHRVAVDPVYGWWNAGVANALLTYGTGLLTGQETIDDVLKAMDAAWKLGPD